MQEIARQSEGIYKLGPGTLYDNLEKLIQADGFTNWVRAGEMMIPAGAITDSLMLDKVSSEPRRRA